MPSHLPSDMAYEWRTAAADLVGRGLLTPAVIAILEAYIGALWMARECRKAIAEHGVLIAAGKGGMKPNPAGAMLKAANESIARLADDLGLSPVSRARPGIRAQVKSHDEENDPFGEFDL